jgi:hypothetical protein
VRDPFNSYRVEKHIECARRIRSARRLVSFGLRGRAERRRRFWIGQGDRKLSVPAKKKRCPRSALPPHSQNAAPVDNSTATWLNHFRSSAKIFPTYFGRRDAPRSDLRSERSWPRSCQSQRLPSAAKAATPSIVEASPSQSECSSN